jgi:hypothetical protein
MRLSRPKTTTPRQSTVPRVAPTSRANRTLASAAADVLRGIPSPALTALAHGCLDGTVAAPPELVALLVTLTADPDAACLLPLALLAHARGTGATAPAEGGPDDDVARRIRAALKGHAAQPAGANNDAPGVGDLQNRLAAWARRHCPVLLREGVAALPELRTPMPVLEATAQRLAEVHGRPLAAYDTLIIGHVLGEIDGFLDALEQVGLEPAQTEILAVPYSSNELAIEAARLRGYATENPQGVEAAPTGAPRWGMRVDANVAFRDVDDLAFEREKEASVERALRRMLERHRRCPTKGGGRPILVIDDGGYAAAVASKRLTPEERALFRFVEQTTRGARKLRACAAGRENIACEIASSRVKRLEDPFVADACIETLTIALRDRAGGSLVGKRVAMLGFGHIGGRAAEALRAAGAHVVVFDTSADAIERARRLGFEVASRCVAAVAGKDFVVGSTGYTSLSADDYLALAPGTTLVPISSMDVEFRRSWLNAQALVEVLVAVAAWQAGGPPAMPRMPGLDLRIDVPALAAAAITVRRQHRLVRELAAGLGTLATGHTRGMRTQVKASLHVFDPTSLLERFVSAAAPEALPTILASATRQTVRCEVHEAIEGGVGGVVGRAPIWLENGGFPLNLSRRLQSMPPERIQVTLAALVSAAVQVAVTPDTASGAGGPIGLDDEEQDRIEANLRRLGRRR